MALHSVLKKAVSSDDGEDVESGDRPASTSLSEIDPLLHGSDRFFSQTDSDERQLRNSSVSYPSIVYIESEKLPETVRGNHQEETAGTMVSPVEYDDKLYLYLKENLDRVKAYAVEIAKRIPVPDQCTIEGKRFELLKPEKFLCLFKWGKKKQQSNCQPLI